MEYGISQITIFYFVIGAIYWLTMSRVVRGQIISLKHEQFVDAARTIGAGTGRIIFRHLIPNVLGIVIVYLTLTIPSVMLFEAFLSFLGLGVQPPDVSWGLLVNDGDQGHHTDPDLLVARTVPGPGPGHDAVCPELPGRRPARRARSEDEK